MGISLRPWPEDERTLSDADLWDKKVTDGLSEQDATTYVETRRQRQQMGAIGGMEKAAPLAGAARTRQLIRETPRPSVLSQRLSAITDGMFSGWADEMATASAYGLGKVMQPFTGNAPNYDLIRAQSQMGLKQAIAERPKETLGLQVAGGVAQGMGLAGALKAGGVPLTTNLLNPSTGRGLAALGAAQGAVAGAGGAEDDQRTSGALVGAGLGAVLTPAIAKGGGYALDALNLRGRVSPLAQALWQRLSGATDNAAGTMGDDAARVTVPVLGAGSSPRLLTAGASSSVVPRAEMPLATRGGSLVPADATARAGQGRAGAGAADRLRGLVQAARRGIAGDAPPVASNQERAAQLILRDLGADNLSVDALEQAAQQANPRIPATPFNLAPEKGNVVGRARTAQSFPGPGQTTLATRTAAQLEDAPERVLTMLRDRSGIAPRNVPNTLEAMDAIRGEEAAALYGLARQYGTVADPRLDELVETPAFQRAVKAAAEGLRNRRQPAPQLVEVDGRLQFREPPTVAQLDRIKKALDDMVSPQARGPLEAGGLGPTGEADIKAGVTQTVLDVLHDATDGAYTQARERFAAQSRAMQALDDGRRRFLTMPLDELQAYVQRLSPAEREAWQTGAMQALNQNVMGAADRAGTATRALGSNEAGLARQRLALLFGDNVEGLAGVSADAALERRIAGDRNVIVNGSPTARIGAGQEDQLADAVEGAVDVAKGNADGLLRRALRSSLAARARGLNRDLNANLADLLTAGTGQSGRPREQELADLIALLRRVQAQQGGARAANVGRAVGGTAASDAGAGRR